MVKNKHNETNNNNNNNNNNHESVEEAVFRYVGEGLHPIDTDDKSKGMDSKLNKDVNDAAHDVINNVINNSDNNDNDDNLDNNPSNDNSANDNGNNNNVNNHNHNDNNHNLNNNENSNTNHNNVVSNNSTNFDNSSDMSWYLRHEEDLQNSHFDNDHDSINSQTVAMAAVVAAYADEKRRRMKRDLDEMDVVDNMGVNMGVNKLNTNNNKDHHNDLKKSYKKLKNQSLNMVGNDDDKVKSRSHLAVDPELATLDNPSTTTQEQLVRKAIIDTDSIAQNPDFQQYLNTEAEPLKNKNDNNELLSHGVSSKDYSDLTNDSSVNDSRLSNNNVSNLHKDRDSNDEDTHLLQNAATKASQLIGSSTATQTSGKAFDTAEEAALDQFIEEYRGIKKFTRRETCERIWTNGRRRDDFWINICKVLPYRTRSSIYKHVRRRYHIFAQRGKWTPQEDSELARLCVELEGQWSEVGQAMGRMPEDCRDRWRNYIKCGENRASNKWSPEEEALLRKVINDMVEEADDYQHKLENGLINLNDENAHKISRGPRGKKISGKPTFKDIINWTVVSERMGGTRSRIQCRYKWNKIIRKEAIAKIENITNDEKRWLLEKLRDLGFTDDSQVDWDELAALQGKKWSGLELKVCYERMRTTIKTYKDMSINEIARTLIDILANTEMNLE